MGNIWNRNKAVILFDILIIILFFKMNIWFITGFCSAVLLVDVRNKYIKNQNSKEPEEPI